jgi:hypothetical protein
MEDKGSRTLRTAAACSAVACLLQIVGLDRYLRRLPDHSVGIGLYAVALIAFALRAIGLTIQGRQ